MGKLMLCTCPTRSGAVLLTKGLTFHYAFKANTLAPGEKTITEMKKYLTEDIIIIVVDEVSMLSIENLVLLDERLRTIYNSNLEFGGKSIILCGDFL